MPQPLKIDQQRLLAVGHGNFNIVSTLNEPDMLVKVCKHGNSLSIRLGAYVTRSARIKCGDWVDVVLLSSGEIRIKPKTGPEPLEAGGEAMPTDQAPAIEEEQW